MVEVWHLSNIDYNWKIISAEVFNITFCTYLKIIFISGYKLTLISLTIESDYFWKLVSLIVPWVKIYTIIIISPTWMKLSTTI